MQKAKHHQRLPDIHQSWWQLAAIQLTGVTSLPVLTSSILILQNSNFISSVLTLILGNFILWIMRLSIILMSNEDRKNVLDVARVYFGNFGAYFIAILILVSTLAWFVMQTSLSSNALNFLIPIEKGIGIDRFIQIGVFLGIVSTLLCMEGIVVLRWLAVISFPLLVMAFIGVVFGSNPAFPTSAHNNISFAGLPIVLGTGLGISADLPTFFRHSNSLSESLKALTAIQLIGFVIGLGGLFLVPVIDPWFGINVENTLISGGILKVSLVALIFLSTICTNVSSVYSASVGWELVAPIFAGIKEYLILGLGLTIIFILIGNLFSMDFISDITGNALVNLSIVFIAGFLLSLIFKRPPDSFEQTTYLIAWAGSTFVNILQFSDLFAKNVSSIILGFIIILLTVFFALSSRKVFHFCRSLFMRRKKKLER